MSSSDVAPATSAIASVIARETVHANIGVIQIKVSPDAQLKHFGDTPYLSFDRGFRGGRTFCFLHSGDKGLAGKVVTARVSVECKHLDNGCSYYHLNLEPVNDDTPVTHSLLIVHKDDDPKKDDAIVFVTPPPLNGLIIFGAPKPPKEKKATLPPVIEVLPPPPPKAKKAPSKTAKSKKIVPPVDETPAPTNPLAKQFEGLGWRVKAA